MSRLFRLTTIRWRFLPQCCAPIWGRGVAQSSRPISTLACPRPRSWTLARGAQQTAAANRVPPGSMRLLHEDRAMMALLIRDLRLATRAGGGFGLALAFFLIVCTL